MGVTRRSRLLQFVLNCHRERVRKTENAPRGPLRVLENRHGLAQIVERGGRVRVLTAPRSSPEAASPTAVSATRPDTPAPPGTRRRSHNDSCAHRLVFDDRNVNGGQWRDEDVLASGLSRVAVEPAPKRRRRRGGEPAVRFTAPLSERQAVQGQYDEQNRRP